MAAQTIVITQQEIAAVVRAIKKGAFKVMKTLLPCFYVFATTVLPQSFGSS